MSLNFIFSCLPGRFSGYHSLNVFPMTVLVIFPLFLTFPYHPCIDLFIPSFPSNSSFSIHTLFITFNPCYIHHFQSILSPHVQTYLPALHSFNIPFLFLFCSFSFKSDLFLFPYIQLYVQEKQFLTPMQSPPVSTFSFPRCLSFPFWYAYFIFPFCHISTHSPCFTAVWHVKLLCSLTILLFVYSSSSIINIHLLVYMEVLALP